jgi:hypothetical protein
VWTVDALVHGIFILLVLNLLALPLIEGTIESLSSSAARHIQLHWLKVELHREKSSAFNVEGASVE